jgi:hypothetical protein
MTTFGCAEVRELAPELAVNIVGGPTRAEALQHMSGCGPCRVLVGELAEAADALTLLAQEAEPPPGFEKRVLASIGSRNRRPRRRTVTAVAMAVAASAIISIVGVRLVEGNDQKAVVADPGTESVQKVNMISSAAQNVGRMFVSSGHPSVVMIAVNYTVPDGTYSIELQSAARGDRHIADMQVANGWGSWGGVARVPSGSSIALVGADGTVLCSAKVPTVA